MVKTFKILAQEEIEKGGDADACLKRFFDNVKSLLGYLSDVNAESGSPIQPFLINILINGVSSVQYSTQVKICEEFLNRCAPQFENIKSREVEKFRPVAKILFAEVPENIVEQISDFICSGKIADEHIAMIFNYIDSLIRISIKRSALLEKEETAEMKTGLVLFFPK